MPSAPGSYRAAANLSDGGKSEHDHEWAIDYSIDRGSLFGHARDMRATPLAGGVSGYAVLVESNAGRVVVKRALRQLRVHDEWYAKPERAVTEAAAMHVLHQITPGHTPELLDVDPKRFTLTMTAAPSSWQPWKSRLLKQNLDLASEVRIAGQLGSVVGTWHQQTGLNSALAEQFNDYEALEQLRIGPFHRVVKRTHPAIAGAIEVCLNDLLTRRDCLVHGDLSPKNVLVGQDGLMVIDFEVAHVGAAVFDVAFLQSHLLLKAAHRPPNAKAIRSIGEAFLTRYINELSASPAPRLAWHTAALLLARVDGTSCVDYLDERSTRVVRDVALATLQAGEPSLDDLWNRIEQATR